MKLENLNKSITQLTTEEQLQLVQKIRESRLRVKAVYKASNKKKTKKIIKPKTTTKRKQKKVKSKEDLMYLISKMEEMVNEQRTNQPSGSN